MRGVGGRKEKEENQTTVILIPKNRIHKKDTLLEIAFKLYV